MGGPKRLFHVLDGEAVFTRGADVLHALKFPEWRDHPWLEAEIEAYERKQAKLAEAGLAAIKPAAE
jgi:hypothetical protein